MSSILLQRPTIGQSIAIAPQTNENLNLGFTADEAELSREGENLIFSFEDGARIELTNFYNAYDAQNMPEFTIEGTTITGDAFFAALSEDLMPAAGVSSSAIGTGSTVKTVEVNLLEGLSSLNSIDQDNTQTIVLGDGVTNNNSGPAQVNEDDTNQVPATNFANAINLNNVNPATNPTDSTVANTTVPSTPSTSAPAGPTFNAVNDVLAADAGSTLTGNLLANDNIPENSSITSMEIPADWSAIENDDNSVTLTSKDGLTQITVHTNGDYKLMTDTDDLDMPNIELGYTVTDQNGQEYIANITIGNSNAENLFIETLQGGQTEVTNLDTNNTYTHEFSSYIDNPNIGNQHINGMLLGEGDDQITVNTAIGSQTDLNYAGVGDTFIYGDRVDIYSQDQVGDDTINIGTLDGTKIRADGNLFNSVEGGDDTINVEHMEFGSIIGDGWTLNAGTKGGDDIINVGTMNAGEIYGEGKTQNSSSIGGNDTITIDTIDTTASGRQSIIIDGDGGDDVINISNINITGSDSVSIDGGLGSDIFNYDNDGDNTMALLNGQVFIKDVAGTNFKNFEGIGSGAGDDLLKLYGTFDDVVIDGGEDMDILLADLSSISEVEDMINKDLISNTEFIVLNDNLNEASTTSTNDLLNKLESEGVSHKDGTMQFDDTWTQGTSVGDYDQYTNDAGDMTILVAKTQLENAVI